MAYDLELQRFEDDMELPATPRDRVGLAVREQPMTVEQIAELTGLDQHMVRKVVERGGDVFARLGELVGPQDPNIPDWYRSLLVGRVR